MSETEEELRQAAAMLTILLATCDTTLRTLEAAGNPVDADLVKDLRAMVERTERELVALNASS